MFTFLWKKTRDSNNVTTDYALLVLVWIEQSKFIFTQGKGLTFTKKKVLCHFYIPPTSYSHVYDILWKEGTVKAHHTIKVRNNNNVHTKNEQRVIENSWTNFFLWKKRLEMSCTRTEKSQKVDMHHWFLCRVRS